MKIFSSSIFIVAIGMALFSCKKETITSPVVVTPPVASSTTEAVLKFNNNLTDSTGKTTGIVSGNVSYVNDRNGNAGSALFMDGSSKITFSNLNLKGTAFTMTAWVKYDNVGGGLTFFLTAMKDGAGPALVQTINKLGCSVSTPNTNTAYGSAVDASWHHLAVTYDGADIKIYNDGTLTGTMNHPGSMGDGKRDMIIAFFNGNYWKGSIDELRVYSEVMAPAAILKLAAL
jgi:hypothetical protein